MPSQGAIKFHPEFRSSLIQCGAKFEWNLDRSVFWPACRPGVRSFSVTEAPPPLADPGLTRA